MNLIMSKVDNFKIANEDKIPASVCRKYVVTRKDLPLSCPMPDMRLWDAHPRIYMPIAKTGHVICPYCDAEYILKDDELS